MDYLDMLDLFDDQSYWGTGHIPTPSRLASIFSHPDVLYFSVNNNVQGWNSIFFGLDKPMTAGFLLYLVQELSPDSIQHTPQRKTLCVDLTSFGLKTSDVIAVEKETFTFGWRTPEDDDGQ